MIGPNLQLCKSSSELPRSIKERVHITMREKVHITPLCLKGSVGGW